MNCLHPITVDTKDSYGVWWRSCAFCPTSYNRSLKVLIELRKQCERAWGIDFARISSAVKEGGQTYYSYGSLPGTAVVSFSEEKGDHGMTPCVYARCDQTGDEVGPIWGDGDASVKRALATLSENCSCGHRFHKVGNG